MPRKKRLINKQIKKKSEKKCYFCDENNYASLAVHRIVYGENGGKYTPSNSLVCCANCHTKIHDGQIVIDRKYSSTAGKEVLHYWIEGKEYWT